MSLIINHKLAVGYSLTQMGAVMPALCDETSTSTGTDQSIMQALAQAARMMMRKTTSSGILTRRRTEALL